MTTITISKTEYAKLKQEAKAYRDIASSFASKMLEKPISAVVENFKATGKYSKEFLADLKDGLADLRKSKAWKSK